MVSKGRNVLYGLIKGQASQSLPFFLAAITMLNLDLSQATRTSSTRMILMHTIASADFGAANRLRNKKTAIEYNDTFWVLREFYIRNVLHGPLPEGCDYHCEFILEQITLCDL